MEGAVVVVEVLGDAVFDVGEDVVADVGSLAQLVVGDVVSLEDVREDDAEADVVVGHAGNLFHSLEF